jgi:hypothetical protein
MKRGGIIEGRERAGTSLGSPEIMGSSATGPASMNQMELD